MDSTRLAVNVAAQEGDINKLYLAIRENPQVVEEIDSLPFVDTPLHIAAKAGHIPFVAEVMKLKPSFSWKLNVEGYPPIHLAQQHGHNSMVIDIISKNKELIRAKARKDRTPLHLASKKGEIQLLIKFLEACPSSIEDVTVKRETALHIAVRCRQYDSLYILVGWLVKNSRFGAKQLESSILNWKDVEGNTALHVSSHQNNLQMVQLLMKSKLLDLQSKNNEGRSALDVATGGDIISVLIAAGASSSVIANVGTNFFSGDSFIMFLLIPAAGGIVYQEEEEEELIC
ncbi:hypothetical protein VNO78_06548 [Psophocarpus tetragonolobus]|uniref:Ankyrin repeat-containing protein BDA1-like n=1 Tax=Psophocarpus tetragonolobus TaxID=3891 RepID=A0AAN9XRY0_PSOTE